MNLLNLLAAFNENCSVTNHYCVLLITTERVLI